MGLGVNLGVNALAGSATSFANDYSVGFDGSDDYAQGTGAFTSFNGQGAVSINFWFKRDDVTNNEYIMTQYESGSNNFYAYAVGNSRVDLYLNGSTRVRYTQTMANDTWYNLGFTYDGSQGSGYQRSKGYWNGAAHGTSFNTTFTSIGTFTSPLKYSGRWNASNGNNDLEYAGNVDEVSIWQSALSEANHTAIYNSGTPLDISTLGFSGLTNWWRGGDNNGGTGTTMNDHVGSYNIALINGSAFEANVP